MARVIGIDLGTTNSCVAIVEVAGGASARDVKVIANAEGARTTPSVVGFSPSGERLIGQIARRQAVTNATNTIYAVKRLMGQKLDSPAVQKQRELAPYQIVAAPDGGGDAWVQVEGKALSPQEISSMVLTELKRIAESYLGESVEEAVITVPAYFDDAQRQATKDAGRIAGLNVKRIINEPTAAALAYGLDDPSANKTIVVYDLGGGTFDVSILQIAEGVFNVKATGGDTHLGGEDFDQRLIDLLAEEFHKAHGIQVKNDAMGLQRLKEGAEKAKHELSSSLETEINIPFIAVGADGAPVHLQRAMRRSELETLCKSLVDRTIDVCKAVMADAKISIAHVDDVVLVGGMTRMPAVQLAVKELFGKEASRGVNPDEVVAVGAALQGASLGGSGQVLLLDVTPLSIGVETGGGVMTRLIPRNTTIPTEQTEIFTTSVDNQNFVPVHVLQGERDMAADCKSLAQFELTGIPPAPRGVPKIQVTFNVDENGILAVTAKDLGSGKSHGVKVQPASGLSPEQVERLVREADRFRDADGQRKNLAEIRNQAETLVYQTEQALDGYGDLIDAAILEEVRGNCTTLKELLASGASLTDIKNAYARLEAAAFRIAESMYGGAEGSTNS